MADSGRSKDDLGTVGAGSAGPSQVAGWYCGVRAGTALVEIPFSLIGSTVAMRVREPQTYRGARQGQNEHPRELSLLTHGYLVARHHVEKIEISVGQQRQFPWMFVLPLASTAVGLWLTYSHSHR